MKVLVIHTLPPEEAGAGRTLDEFDLRDSVQNVADALSSAIVCGVRGDLHEILALLDLHQPQVVFNACEAPLGRPDLEAHVAAMLEWARVPFTGCGSETLALCRRKDRVNAVLRNSGVPVPAAVDPDNAVFPCFVKPSAEDGSADIHHDCLCENQTALFRVLERLKRPALIEEFLPGREFVVSLWGCAQPEYVSLGETIFRNNLRMITYAAKWQPETADFADSPLSYDSEIAPDLRDAIVNVSRRVWHVVGARHYLRVDVRLDNTGKPRVLDVNPNPEISPGVGVCRAVEEAGWPWRLFVQRILEWALLSAN